MPENIVLIGFMGSGKTTVGKILATRLGWRFRDTDAMIEKKFAMTIEAIFDELGEDVFREMERMVVAEVARTRRAVIATGGGAVLKLDNVQRLQEGNRVVWLQVKPATAIKRAGLTADRPLLQDRQPEDVAALLRCRELFYAFADVHIDTEGKDAAAVADEIEEALQTWLANLK